MTRLILVALFTAAAVTALPRRYQDNADAEMESLGRELDKAQLTEKTSLRFGQCNLQDSTVRVGDSLDFKCEAVSIPAVNIYWLLDGRLIQGTKRRNNIIEKMRNIGKEVISSTVSLSRLRVPCVDHRNAGILTVVIDNGHQRKRLQAKIRVNEGLTSKCAAAATRAHPIITFWTDARFENIGNSVLLTCRPGSKLDEVAWYDADRKALNHADGYEVIKNGDLLIKELGWEHMGQFTCVVSNLLGQDRANAFVYPTAPQGTVDEPTMEELEEMAQMAEMEEADTQM